MPKSQMDFSQIQLSAQSQMITQLKLQVEDSLLNSLCDNNIVNQDLSLYILQNDKKQSNVVLLQQPIESHQITLPFFRSTLTYSDYFIQNHQKQDVNIQVCQQNQIQSTNNIIALNKSQPFNKSLQSKFFCNNLIENFSMIKKQILVNQNKRINTFVMNIFKMELVSKISKMNIKVQEYCQKRFGKNKFKRYRKLENEQIKFYETKNIKLNSDSIILQHKHKKIDIIELTSYYWKVVEILDLTSTELSNIEWQILCQNAFLFPNSKGIKLNSNKITKINKNNLEVFQSLRCIDFGKQKQYGCPFDSQTLRYLCKLKRINEKLRIIYYDPSKNQERHKTRNKTQNIKLNNEKSHFLQIVYLFFMCQILFDSN